MGVISDFHYEIGGPKEKGRRQVIEQVITIFAELNKQAYAMTDIAVFGDSAGGGLAAISQHLGE